jgi:hypothetical protein
VTLPNVSGQVRALRLVSARGTVVDVEGGEELLARASSGARSRARSRVGAL